MLNRITGKIQKFLPLILLLIAATQGLIYTFLVPPWQHYDEPGHFEFAWLVANRSQWPIQGDYDLGMRREVAASMIEHNFYNGITGEPSLISIDPPNIGISQLKHMPLYYLIASIPLRIFRYTDITFQLYLVRLVSLILYIFTIFFVYKTCKELFSKGNPLRWMVPLFLSFLPPFIDLMTAANNDVAATAFSTFLIWACLHLIIKGPNAINIFWVVIGGVFSILSKSTALFVIPIGIITLILGIFRKRQLIAWGIIFSLPVFIYLIVFSWNSKGPAYFYASNDKFLPHRAQDPQAPVGDYAFIQRPQYSSGNFFFFMIPTENLKKLSGKSITLGVWAWGSQPVDIPSPAFQPYNGEPEKLGDIHLGTEPKFFTFVFKVPYNSSLGWILVYPSTNFQTNIYWDGWSLQEGNLSETAPPKFSDQQATNGIWNGKPFHNMINNASAEIVWPVIRPAFGQLLEEFDFNSSYVWSWLDQPGMGWYYQDAAQQIFRSFWGKFSWSQITLTGNKPFWVFLALCVLSTIGAFWQAYKHFKKINWSIAILLGLAFIFSLAIALMRGVGNWFEKIFFPGSRYLYPVILPMAVFLCSGWYSIAVQFPNKPRLKIGLGFLFVTLLVAYDIWAISSILQFFRGNI